MTEMKKSVITAASIALLFAGASFAQQGDAKPEMKQEMKQEQKQEQAQQKKQATPQKRKCPQGQVYSKKSHKCMPKAAKSTPPKSPAAGDAPKSPAAEGAPKSPAAEAAPGANK
jgi:hypothetical protein